MIDIPALEFHLAHGCNLSCQQCSHYSNFHLAGQMPTPDDARREYSHWSHRIRPKRFALLGGEPLLNPHLIEHLRLARESWPDSDLMLVTNGFFLRSPSRTSGNARRNRLPTRSQPAWHARTLSGSIQRSEENGVAMASRLSRHPNQDSTIPSRLDATVPSRRRQTDAIRFQSRCSVQNLHAENVHSAISQLLMEMSRTCLPRIDGATTAYRDTACMATVSRLQGMSTERQRR